MSDYDPTYELCRDDDADPMNWGDEIPLDGSVVPGAAADMDAECMFYAEWGAAYGCNKLDTLPIPSWEWEPEYPFFGEA